MAILSSITLRWYAASFNTGIMQERILSILYDLALTIGGEDHVKPLLVKTLLRFIYHTAFPSGVVLKGSLPTTKKSGTLSLEVNAAIGDKYLLPVIDQEISWPYQLVSGPAAQLEADSLLDSLPLHQAYYETILRLPVPDFGVMLLFTPKAADYDIPYSAIFRPVLANFAHAIKLCTKSEMYATGLIEDREHAEQALYEEKERALVTLHSIGDAVITTDGTGNIRYLNPIAEGMTGWKTVEVKGRHLDEIFHIVDERTECKIASPVEKALTEGITVTLDNHTLLINRYGKEIAIENSAAPILDGGAKIIGVVLVFHDASKTKQLARDLSWQASHDPLTGLVNRREFEQRLASVLESAHQQSTEHVLFYIDLDQFKVINDACGHVAGDELLKQITSLMQIQVRENDLLARLGGDEFGVLLEHCEMDQAKRVADAIRERLKEFRFVWENKQFSIGVSIGAVSIDAQSQSITQLMSSSDMACFAAKDWGGNRIHVYQEGEEELSKRRGEMQWVSRLHDALQENRFELFCQPIVPSNQIDAGKYHYEILLRMVGDHGELIPPNAFIPAAERYGLMIEIDRWVIEHALEIYSELSPRLSGKEFTFSINLSGSSLGDENLKDHIHDQIKRFNIPAHGICFEITETAVIGNLVQAQSLIKEFRKLGCCFALDDFGSGLSSFSYLKNLPVDYLKIDGCFIRDILEDEIHESMVRAINQVSHIMGLKTIAEYVDNNETLERLKDIGIDYAQGYGIQKPFPVKQILKLH